MSEIESILESRGVRPSAVRILIYKTISGFDFVFSLSDIEEADPSLDRSTIFRALKIFLEAGILHEVDDGSGRQKYCMCHCNDASHHSPHVHISCERCHRTYCLTAQEPIHVEVPKGFIVTGMNFVIKGLCPECQKLS